MSTRHDCLYNVVVVPLLSRGRSLIVKKVSLVTIKGLVSEMCATSVMTISGGPTVSNVVLCCDDVDRGRWALFAVWDFYQLRSRHK